MLSLLKFCTCTDSRVWVNCLGIEQSRSWIKFYKECATFNTLLNLMVFAVELLIFRGQIYPRQVVADGGDSPLIFEVFEHSTSGMNGW